MTRPRHLHLLAALVLTLLGGLPAPAAALCPGSTVRLLVPFPSTSSSTVTLARAVADKLSEQWGRQVILDHRPGAGGVAATQVVATSAGDGCTLGVVTAAIAANPSLMKGRLPYDTLRDLSMVTQLANIPTGLFALPDFPASTVAEFIAHARQQPQGLAFASPGVGTASHLAGALLGQAAGIRLIHIPYKGAAQAELDLLAGRVPVMFAAVSSEIGQLQAGRLKLLAMASETRFPGLPHVPTIGESIPGYALRAYLGVVAPSTTPRPLVEKIAQDIARALASDDLQARLKAMHLVPLGSSPDAFERLVRKDMQDIARLVETAGIASD